MIPQSREYYQYGIVQDAFSRIENKILANAEKSKFPMSNTALYYNVKKIDIILDSLQKSIGSFYVSQILTRVIIEHFLVGYYIWTKSEDDNNDECGVEYNIHYFCSEFFKREGYRTSIDNIKNGSNDKFNLPAIQGKYSGLQDMEQSDLEDVHRAASQFDIRKIGDYLVNKTQQTGYFRQVNLMSLEFLDMYNFLSSYVHGGPFSEQQTFFDKYNNDISQEATEYKNLQFARSISNYSKTNMLFSLARDFRDEYKQPLADMLLIDKE